MRVATMMAVVLVALGPTALAVWQGAGGEDSEVQAVGDPAALGLPAAAFVVPEPATLVLMATGGLAVVATRRRRR
ncbi:MAG: PEP-CTERM sorting domain-containing protein [Planctomycetes bacterium]|nr:PEP-CTERM sorting domain-containing protein [Planctomycetota bacterium]